jgi:hypothetical protein
MRGRRELPSEIEIREFRCRPTDRALWKSAHHSWWPERRDVSVWGRFANQAACGRYTFSSVNQPDRHFAETLVAWHLEREGYVCWTGARIFREPNRRLGKRAAQTELVDCLLQKTTRTVPQREYEKKYFSKQALRLKSVDIVGFHFGRCHWVFCEVKRHDSVHPQQAAALRFLQGLFPKAVATVFVAWVRETDGRTRAQMTD